MQAHFRFAIQKIIINKSYYKYSSKRYAGETHLDDLDRRKTPSTGAGQQRLSSSGNKQVAL